jgi:hypothetical protein
MMAQVTFRPELKNAGGESMDVLYNGRNVGTMTLLYREGDRLTGSVQLNKHALPTSAVDHAFREIQDYVEATVDALAVPFCQVTVTYGRFDHVIATEGSVGRVDRFVAEEPSREYAIQMDERQQRRQGRKQEQRQEAQPFLEPRKKTGKNRRPVVGEDLLLEEDVTDFYRPLELVIVGEGRNRIEYHIYDAKKQLIAEALVRIKQGDVKGDITWFLSPTEEEMDELTELIVSDFDPEEVDTFELTMDYEGEEVAHIELTHEDFFDTSVDEATTEIIVDDDLDIRLVRDDGDSLTFEIYDPDVVPDRVGTATVDITGRQVSGYIDFVYPGNREEREVIATALMREVDKEREYDTFNVAMLYQDELIDEITFDQREIH